MQAANRVANRLEHALDLMLAALVDRELDPRGPEPLHARRRSRPVVELDPLGQPFERFVDSSPPTSAS